MATTTASGAFVIYHKREASAPELHRGGPWFFAPRGPHGGDSVYSFGYRTRAAALDAAEDWEARQEWEAEALATHARLAAEEV